MLAEWESIPLKSREFIPIAEGEDFPHPQAMDHQEDPFISGLRRIFDRPDAPKPAAVSVAAGMDKSAIRKMLDGSASTPKLRNAVAIAQALGQTVEQVISGATAMRAVAVPGAAGAGAEIRPFDDHAKGGGLFAVECPPQLAKETVVAVIVAGDSMEPVYSDGDILFYTRHVMGVTSEAIGRRCICEDEDDRMWVKFLKNGSEPGLFNLLSINPLGANMHDVRLKWAAPVRLHLPQEFVRKV